MLYDAGWDVVISAYYGLRGAPLNTGGMLILPSGLDAWGNDVLGAHYKAQSPDVMFHLHDIWVLNTDVLHQYPASSWCPVDHQPIPPAVLNGLRACRWSIAMSKFGEREMRKAGLDPLYIPHGFDSKIFAPQDRVTAREAWGVDDDTFFAVAVAANIGTPSRKSLDRILKAWGRFVESHPKSILYLHTMPMDIQTGWNLLHVAQHYGVDPETLRVADTYRHIMGEYGWDAMVQLYNAADVLVAPSMGEGFGIPLIEGRIYLVQEKKGWGTY